MQQKGGLVQQIKENHFQRLTLKNIYLSLILLSYLYSYLPDLKFFDLFFSLYSEV